MAPKNKGIKVSLLELINETGAKGDFDEATYSSKVFDYDDKAGMGRSFNQRKFQSDGQKPEDDVWRQPKSRLGDGVFEKSSRNFQPTDDSGFDRSNLPSRQALLEADKSFRKPSGFKTTKPDDLVSDSVWRVSKPTSKPSSGIYFPSSDYNRSMRPSESSVWRSSFHSEVSEPKASEMFVPKPVSNLVREFKQPPEEPAASALENVLPTQPSRIQSNRFASLLDNSVSSEDEEAKNKDLNASEIQKKPETPETTAAPQIPPKPSDQPTELQASSVTQEATESKLESAAEAADEEPFTEKLPDAKKGAKYVPKMKSERLGAEINLRHISDSPDKRDQSPRFKLLMESSDGATRKLYQPRPLADMRNKEFSNKSLDTFIQKKIEQPTTTPQPTTEHTTELSTKARYRKLIQEQKAKKLEMEEEEQRQISKKLAQILETKMMYEDVEKTRRFEEFVKKFLSERRDAEEIQQKISQLFLDEDVESLIPSIVLIKAFILEAYDTLIADIDKPLTDLKRMESVRPLALLIKPALLHLFDHSYIEQHSLLLLQVTQRILHAIKFPKITKGLALIEAVWDALYMTEILSEPTFKQWYADIEDESPGRSGAMFQILPWFEWLNQSTVHNVVNLSEDEEYEEDDEF